MCTTSTVFDEHSKNMKCLLLSGYYSNIYIIYINDNADSETSIELHNCVF